MPRAIAPTATGAMLHRVDLIRRCVLSSDELCPRCRGQLGGPGPRPE